jgi:hypothetical protein
MVALEGGRVADTGIFPGIPRRSELVFWYVGEIHQSYRLSAFAPGGLIYVRLIVYSPLVKFLLLQNNSYCSIYQRLLIAVFLLDSSSRFEWVLQKIS